MRLRDFFSRPGPNENSPSAEELIGLQHAAQLEFFKQTHALKAVPPDLDLLSAMVDKAIEATGEADDLDPARRQRMVDHITQLAADLGPLFEPMIDSSVAQVTVNGYATVYVQRDGVKQRWPIPFSSPEHLRHVIERLMLLNPGRRVDESTPMSDLSLADGARVNVTLPPAVMGGPHLTIRKYLRRYGHLADLVDNDMLDERMASFLQACVKARVSILLSGVSGSGKTTIMEALARFIPDQERIVTIEDVPELHLEQPEVVRLITRQPNLAGVGEISTRELFTNTLRMRADRVLLGEIRGAEALDYLQSLNAAGGGSLAVLHASSAFEAILRLENLVPLAKMAIPSDVTRKQIGDGLDLVVHSELLPNGMRRITEISEVITTADGGLAARLIFGWNATGPKTGSYQASGVVPTVQRRLELAGTGFDPVLYVKG